MSKYKVGDKVVLEITKGKTLLGTDYYLFNDGFGIRQGLVELNAEPLTTYTEQARAEGQNEAWELARKIVSDIYHGGYNSDELKEIFGYFLYQNIWEDNTYPEAAAKVAQWEKAKEKPQKTILMDLLEKLPNIETEVDGLPKFCPFALGYDVLCSSKKTCKECWNRPLEQIGEE